VFHGVTRHEFQQFVLFLSTVVVVYP